MVAEPDIEELVRVTARCEEVESSKVAFARSAELLSELSQSRVKDTVEIPSMLSKGQFSTAGTKRAFP